MTQIPRDPNRPRPLDYHGVQPRPRRSPMIWIAVSLILAVILIAGVIFLRVESKRYKKDVEDSKNRALMRARQQQIVRPLDPAKAIEINPEIEQINPDDALRARLERTEILRARAASQPTPQQLATQP